MPLTTKTHPFPMGSHLHWAILQHFSRKRSQAFTFSEAKDAFPDNNHIHLGKVLAYMVRTGKLQRIGRGKFVMIPIGVDPKSFCPDALQLADYLMKGKAYYIGYLSALKVHGLARPTESDIVYLVTAKHENPLIRRIGDVDYHLIKHTTNRFFGFESVWINQLEQVKVSDLEKTIVDIASRPQYGGGIVELGHALHEAKDRIKLDNLMYYLARNENKSAKKRILFLSELLELKWTREHETMMKELGTGYSLLDPTLSVRGKTLKKFRLKINTNPDLIKKQIL